MATLRNLCKTWQFVQFPSYKAGRKLADINITLKYFLISPKTRAVYFSHIDYVNEVSLGQ